MAEELKVRSMLTLRWKVASWFSRKQRPLLSNLARWKLLLFCRADDRT